MSIGLAESANKLVVYHMLSYAYRRIRVFKAAYSGRHHITVTDFGCPKCEAPKISEKSPGR
jgi:hypothetical protein